MRLTMRWAFALVTLLPAFLRDPTGAAEPVPLPGTQPLTLEGDIASQLLEGVDRYLLRKTDESVVARREFWKRDLRSAEAYQSSITPNRERLKAILGLRDAGVPFDAPELVATTALPALVGKGDGYDIQVVRWPAFGEVHAEGLLLVPTQAAKTADVVAIPDADQTPEQLCGLVEGVPAASQFARRLAESGCRVLVPVLIDRRVEPRNGRVRLTSREYLYRSAYELGRHPIGYEVQKVLAGVDWFVKDAKGSDARIGVFGWGEGGLIALHAGAIDARIDAVGISGHFNNRQGLWREPIDRNVFGLLEQFGDAEIASLVAPRALLIEAAKGPEVEVPPGTGGGPGRLSTPDLKSVRDEIERARGLTRGLDPSPPLDLVISGDQGTGPFGSEPALRAFLKALSPGAHLTADAGKPRLLRSAVDADARQARQVHELDRHNQWLLSESASVRRAYFAKLDTSSLDAFNASIEPYRTAFRDEVIGQFNEPLLAPAPRSRRVYDEPDLTGYEVVMDVFPDVIAYGILLVPKGIKEGERRPMVVCQHGLEGRPQDVANPRVDEPIYKQFAVKLARSGFITFAPQNLYLLGDRFRTLQRKANPLKKTLFSIMVPQHQQLTDWFKSLPFVDPARIGFYGLSYGGKSAMRIPPLVANYSLSICSADFNEWVAKNASTRTPYSYVWTPEYEIYEFNLGGTFNYAEMAALIAPRPFMVERGHFDGVGSDEDVAHEFAKVRFLYEAKLGLGDRCEIDWFTGPHSIHGVGTYAFLHRHLKWKRPSPPSMLPLPGHASP
ncbi:MAG: hypothetical protein NVSMB9_19820 [Isosphaeraceae bacterium]